MEAELLRLARKEVGAALRAAFRETGTGGKKPKKAPKPPRKKLPAKTDIDHSRNLAERYSSPECWLGTTDTHCIVLTDKGAVCTQGRPADCKPVPEFALPVTSVHAGLQLCAALGGGRVTVWGAGSAAMAVGLAAVADKNIVALSTSVYSSLMAMVDSDGRLHFAGAAAAGFAVPESEQGSFSSVACGEKHVVVRTKTGDVSVIHAGKGLEKADAGALAVRAGRDHSAVLKHDGSVTCFGRNEHSQCDAPAGMKVYECECGDGFTVATALDGVHTWGSYKKDYGALLASGCDVGCTFVVGGSTLRAVASDGRTVAA
eukprot:TRINITY_DN4200_c0_g1_i1.p1 TRINITY_DN4200_c0_g1~~TRINITY_DN4200_c0_g1_i1.p1  ORF type:complete len:316 (+),score=72.71 TRINITY_DN4200_c0_g1_i1:47-994(+)